MYFLTDEYNIDKLQYYFNCKNIKSYVKIENNIELEIEHTTTKNIVNANEIFDRLFKLF